MALLLVDVSSLIYRAFHSLSPENFKRPSDNLSNNAVYGVALTMFKIMDDVKQKYGDVYPIACFDSPTCNETRKVEQIKYKLNRPKCPTSLGHQFDWIRELFQSMQIVCIEIQSHEADDIIATLCETNKNNYHTVVIVSPDKDLNQLILSDNIIIFNPRSKLYFSQETIQEKIGFHPKFFTIYQALVGDAADNITGVKGIGHKSAVEILKNCNGNLENIIPTKKLLKKIKLIENNKDIIESNMKMVTLNTVLDLNYNYPNKFQFNKKQSFGQFLNKMEINAKALWKYGK